MLHPTAHQSRWSRLDDRQGWIEGSSMLETGTIQGFKDYPIPQSIPYGHLDKPHPNPNGPPNTMRKEDGCSRRLCSKAFASAASSARSTGTTMADAST